MNREAEEGHREEHPCQCPVLPGRMQRADSSRPLDTGPLAMWVSPPHFVSASSWSREWPVKAKPGES